MTTCCHQGDAKGSHQRQGSLPVILCASAVNMLNVSDFLMCIYVVNGDVYVL